MTIPIIETGIHFARVPRMTITIERWTPPRVPNPTERELGMCPASFRCYSCLQRKGKKHFGGLVLDKRICRTCYPFVEEGDVAAMIRFDRKHGFKVD